LILKEIDPKQTTNKMLAAGVNAEKQMAHYLKRAYESSDDIFVINDLRIQMNSDIAQIDHLVIHKYGFIVIESKSVSAKISINEHDEWARHYGKTKTGMPSAINQAKRQADFLKNYLMSSTVELIRTRKLFPVSFSDFTYETLVAISDKGLIERHSKANCDNLYKADQITSVIDKQYSQLCKNAKNLLINIPYVFSPKSLFRLKKFLVSAHTPSKSSSSPTSTAKDKTDIVAIAPVNTPVKEVVKAPAETIAKALVKEVLKSEKEVEAPKQKVIEIDKKTIHTCSKCSSDKVNIAYGKFGYYFKCEACGGNTNIKKLCVSKDCKPKLRKEKLNFFIECPTCETSSLFFTNKAV
jgi:hypothetical protein